MAKHITLSPAYGRDYTSQAQVREAFDNNADFIIESFNSPWCGKPCNKADLIGDGYDCFEIRYAAKRKVMMINA